MISITTIERTRSRSSIRPLRDHRLDWRGHRYPFASAVGLGRMMVGFMETTRRHCCRRTACSHSRPADTRPRSTPQQAPWLISDWSEFIQDFIQEIGNTSQYGTALDGRHNTESPARQHYTTRPGWFGTEARCVGRGFDSSLGLPCLCPETTHNLGLPQLHENNRVIWSRPHPAR